MSTIRCFKLDVSIDPTQGAAPTAPGDVAVDAARMRLIESEAQTPELKVIALTGERLGVAEAMRLLMHLDRELRKARAEFNQDRFRRIMCARSKSVSRLQRRWAKIESPPQIPLGSLRRRYHANLSRYLYEPSR
jgi:hypothetical protein